MTGEAGREIIAVGETMSEGDGGDGMFRIAEFLCRLLQTDRVQIFDGTCSERGTEERGQR